ncbi:hypothetical protein [Mycolicibacterium thermoresistibile]
MTEPSRYAKLTAEVSRAELIPAGRPLAAEEILWLDGLAARLRRQFSRDRSAGTMGLLRRVSGVRTGMRVAVPAPTQAAASPPAAARRKRKTKDRPTPNTRELAFELDRISAAGRPMSEPDAQALDDIVGQLWLLTNSSKRARLLWLRARDVREYLTGKSSDPDRDRSGVPVAGRISAPRGLDSAKRKVSGGLPGTRRGH